MSIVLVALVVQPTSNSVGHPGALLAFQDERARYVHEAFLGSCSLNRVCKVCRKNPAQLPAVAAGWLCWRGAHCACVCVGLTSVSSIGVGRHQVPTCLQWRWDGSAAIVQGGLRVCSPGSPSVPSSSVWCHASLRARQAPIVLPAVVAGWLCYHCAEWICLARLQCRAVACDVVLACKSGRYPSRLPAVAAGWLCCLGAKWIVHVFAWLDCSIEQRCVAQESSKCPSRLPAVAVGWLCCLRTKRIVSEIVTALSQLQCRAAACGGMLAQGLAEERRPEQQVSIPPACSGSGKALLPWRQVECE